MELLNSIEFLKFKLEQHLFDLKTQQEVILSLLKLIQRVESDEEKKANVTDVVLQLGFLNLMNQSLQGQGQAASSGGAAAGTGKALKDDVKLQRKLSCLIANLSTDEKVRERIRTLEGFLKVILSSMSFHWKDIEIFRNWCDLFYRLSLDTAKRHFLLDQFELITNLRSCMKEKGHRQDLRLQQLVLSYLLNMCADEDAPFRSSSPFLSSTTAVIATGLSSPRSPTSPRSSGSPFSFASSRQRSSTSSSTSSSHGLTLQPHSPRLSHPPAHALPSHSFTRLSHPPAHHIDNSTNNQLLKLNLLHLNLRDGNNSSSTTSNSSSPRSSSPSSPPSSLSSPRSPSSPSSPLSLSSLSSPRSSSPSPSPAVTSHSRSGSLNSSIRCYSDYILLVGLSPLELVIACHLKDLRIQQLGLGVIRNLSQDRRRHPEIVNNNLFESIRRAMTQHPKDLLIQQLACEIFASFDSWDETLQQALNRHIDKACLRGLLKATRAAILTHLKEPLLQRAALSALSAFISLPIYIDYSKSWDDKILRCIRKSMSQHKLDDQVQRNGCDFLSRYIRFRTLWSDEVLKLVQEAMSFHLSDSKLQAVACSCLYWMAQENYEACLKLGFLDNVKAALINNPLNEEVYLVVKTLLLNYRSYAKDHSLDSLSFFTGLFTEYKTAVSSSLEYLLNSHLTSRLSNLIAVSQWKTALVAAGWADVYIRVKEEGGHYDKLLLGELIAEHILQLFEKRKPFALNLKVKKLDFSETLSESSSEPFINWFFNGLENSDCNLRSLTLTDNKLNTGCIERISTYLMKPFSTLRVLDLSGNRIGDEGAAHLAAALRLNSNLKRLSLYDTSIGSPGKVALEVGLRDSKAPLRLVGIFGHALSEVQTPEARNDRKALMFLSLR